MSIELEMEDGQLRVRVDAPGRAAVSDLVDPMTLIYDICDTAELDFEVVSDELTVVLPAKPAPEGQGSGSAGAVEAPGA